MAQANKDTQRYPGDVSDEERAFVASYLTLMTEDAQAQGGETARCQARVRVAAQ